MTRNSDQDSRLSVAELLARNGAKVTGRAHHRHRRADDDDADAETTAPQQIIERVHAEEHHNGHLVFDDAYVTDEPAGRVAARLDGSTAVEPGRSEDLWDPHDEGPSDGTDTWQTESEFAQPWAGVDIEERYGGSLDLEPSGDDGITEVDDHPVSDDSAAPEVLDTPDDAAEDVSPGRQWFAVASQLILGVVAGATVWLLFDWLWNTMAPVALGAALVVIVGLVWVVRYIRKADDLQTTLLAVLVGLVVTVSPAAMLLL